MTDWRSNPEVRRRRWKKRFQLGIGVVFLAGVLGGMAKWLA